MFPLPPLKAFLHDPNPKQNTQGLSVLPRFPVCGSFRSLVSPPFRPAREQATSQTVYRPFSPESSSSRILCSGKLLLLHICRSNKCRGPLPANRLCRRGYHHRFMGAESHHGRYSARIFHFIPFNPQIVMLTLQERKLRIREVGKLARVHQQHRSLIQGEQTPQSNTACYFFPPLKEVEIS